MIGVALVGAVLVKVWPELYPDIARSAPLDRHCDLRLAPCTSRFPGGGGVRFSITPREIPILKPLSLMVNLDRLSSERVEVDIVGISMDMGFNRTALKARGGGVFSGETTLPVCLSDRMDWEARVLIHTDDGIAAAPFRFSTFREAQ